MRRRQSRSSCLIAPVFAAAEARAGGLTQVERGLPSAQRGCNARSGGHSRCSVENIVRGQSGASLAPQRGAGRGPGSGAAHQKRSTSPRPSPPTSLAEREFRTQRALVFRWSLQTNIAVRAPTVLAPIGCQVLATCGSIFPWLHAATPPAMYCSIWAIAAFWAEMIQLTRSPMDTRPTTLSPSRTGRCRTRFSVMSFMQYSME